MEYRHNLSQQWWEDSVESKQRHERIVQLVDTIKKEQSYVDRDNLTHLRLYIKRNYTADADGRVQPAGSNERIGLNLVKSAIDTVAARICLQKPRPTFLTQGGRWKQRLRAKKLQKFVEGIFYEQDFYAKARRVFKDCAVFGTGFMKFYAENGKVFCERIFPGEMIVDETTAMNTAPRSYFQVKPVPVECLLASFPEYRAEISTGNSYLHMTQKGRTTHMLQAYEAWHLPDVNGAGGRHTICIDGCTLFDEEWKHDFLPIIELRWNELPVGYYGNGAAEDIAGLQNELDFLLTRMQKSLHINANAWYMKHISDKTPNEHLTNEIGNVIEWSGEHPPDLKVFPAIHQQVFDIAKWIYGVGFDDVGVSQMSATSRKPAGVESGIALQTLMDVESQRHGLIQANWEDFVVRCARVLVALGKDTYRENTKVKWDNSRFVETIEWGDVNMEEDEYILKIWPTNLLPASPAGRLDIVEKMLQAGILDPQTAMMLLDFPDVEFIQDLTLAAVKNALWISDQVIYEGADIEPRQYQNLELCIKYIQLGLARAETEGAPPSVIERGLTWIAEATDLMGPPPAPPMLGAPPDQLAAMGLPPDAMNPAVPTPPMGMDPMSGNVPPPPGEVPPVF